ncbi:MAG: hypothetical protein ACQEUY_17415 [Pseudomonadota bacterium]
MQDNSKISRRAFIASASVGGGALISYPINVLGQQGNVYLDIEAYNTINAVKASAKQEFALLCLNPSTEDQIESSAEILDVLQTELDRIVPEIEESDDMTVEEWTRTNFTPDAFNESIPLRHASDIDWMLPVSATRHCMQAVIRVLADIFNIDPMRADELENFLREQNQAIYVEGMASSLEQNDKNQLSNYVELLINDFTISEAIKQAIETMQSPIARAIRLWLMKRSIPFIGLCLAIMDVGISLIKNRDEILDCARSLQE